MPCDTESDRNNLVIFDEVLREITTLAATMNIDNVSRGCDFNTDLTRVNSLHTTSLVSFVQDEHFILLDSLPIFDVEYTYESMANNARSLIDHFMVSQNLAVHVTDISTDACIDNLSDHLVISVELDIAAITKSNFSL
jgi:hypothetical protein